MFYQPLTARWDTQTNGLLHPAWVTQTNGLPAPLGLRKPMPAPSRMGYANLKWVSCPGSAAVHV